MSKTINILQYHKLKLILNLDIMKNLKTQIKLDGKLLISNKRRLSNQRHQNQVAVNPIMLKLNRFPKNQLT